MLDSIRERISASELANLYPQESLDHRELIEGEILTMPSPTPQHQDCVVNLTLLLASPIKQARLGRLQVAPSDVHLDDYNLVQPDLFFVAKDNPRCFLNAENQWQGPPDLCIEILSPSTAKHDRQSKFLLYERFGVREYWIVDPFGQTIEIYLLDGDSFQRQGVYDGEDEIASPTLEALKFAVQAIFAE